MKYTIVILALVPLLLSAAPHPEARAVGASDHGTAKGAVAIMVYDDSGEPTAGTPINKRKSAVAEPGGTRVSIFAIGKDGKETLLPKPISVEAPDRDNDGWVKRITIYLPVKVDPNAAYKVSVEANGDTPPLTFKVDGREVPSAAPLVLNAGEFDPLDIPEAAKPLKPSLSIGGGSDGALLSLRWSAGGNTASDGEFGRWFASIEADISPGDDGSESMVTGRIAGDLEGLWRVIDTRDQLIDVTTYFGVATDFESSQDFDNWDAEVGLSSWWFFQGQPIQTVGNLLRISSDDYLSHPIALKLSADYVFAYERGTGIPDPEDIQVSARLMWLSRIYTNARLPFLDAPFDVNLLVDIGTTWEPDSSKLHPETRLSLEFEPEAYKDSKLAFALTWAQGEFSPTFVDEDALLAGVKLRF